MAAAVPEARLSLVPEEPVAEAVENTRSVATRASREASPFVLLAEGHAQAIPGALISICDIEGGAPKPLGTQMAVLADGRHVGYVSGGCVEAAIAAEVVPLIAKGRDEIIRFGKGSCFIDIRFPCGGGIDLLVHVAPSAEMVDEALRRMERREAFSVAFAPTDSQARVVEADGPTAWHNGFFVRRYLPRTRLVLVGRGPDFELLARVAAAAEFEVSVATPDESSAMALAGLGVPVELMRSPGQALALPIDGYTATVLLFHEHEWENAILARAVAAEGFYVGALGSQKTHRQRRERLSAMGVVADQIDRIRGPVGLINRARDPATLALSVLSEIAALRAELDLV